MGKARVTENKINIYDAKTHLSHLIVRALRGEEIIICRGDVPRVKLVPCYASKSERLLGVDEEKGTIPDDFNVLPDEISETFYGKDKE